MEPFSTKSTLLVFILQIMVVPTLLFGSQFKEKCKKLNNFSAKSSHDTKNSKLRLLSNSKGEKFLLKQGRKATPSSVFRTLLDVLGVSIAQSLSIKCNDIELISAASKCKHKFYSNLPATLHAFVESKSLCRSAHYPGLYLRQRKKSQSAHISPHFSPAIITNMSRHRDLPPLVAVDTFIANTDRSCANLFFQPNTNEFTAIDFGESYKTNLPEEVIKTIRQVQKENIGLTTEEIHGLSLYKKTLDRLLNSYTPAILSKKIDFLLKKANLDPDEGSLHSQCQKYAAKIKTTVKKNYASTAELSRVLGLFIEKQRSKLDSPSKKNLLLPDNAR
jgi:hypothetical protein